MARLATLSSFYMPLALALLVIISNTTNDVHAKHIPALFVFGDSYHDVGQFNYLNTGGTKANIPPYGETFFDQPTGRFSDGRLIPDFIAQYADLPFPPPILQPGLSSYEKGVNFACSGAGALNETFQGVIISLGEQVDYYKKVVVKLRQQFGDIHSKAILSKAVYLLNIGTNDYFYLLSNPTDLTPQYVSLVVGNITTAIKEIYTLGGRKFAISNIGPLGCLPTVKAALNSSTCVTFESQIASLHNQQLKQMLSLLATQYTYFKYGLFDMYTNLEKRIYIPNNYGFQNSTAACCGSGPYNGIFSCGGQGSITTYELCVNPKEYIFWDSAHYTEKVNKQLAEIMWEGSLPDIGPYNVKTLFKV